MGAFRGVKRRQEVLVASPQLTVVEDFGHHPTAISETLRSFRARFPGRSAHGGVRAEEQHGEVD
jgi:UDP-N-acetylmuramate: L-alanyl-gamma-D-glutamyl-meso-diaminopimelate ligase